MKKLLPLLAAVLLPGIYPSLAAPPFSLNEGVAIFEAEDFSTNISPRSAHQWVTTNQVAGYSGWGFMDSTPDNNAVFTNWPVDSPELRYEINFASAGTYRVFVRVYATNATSDSVHWGINGKTNAVGLSWTTYNAWVWTNNAAGSAATITVTNAGLNTLNLWMREDGAKIDRVAIADSTNFQPRIGNSWHIPGNVSEPGVPIMRMPFSSIFSNTPVTIFNGNQFQGGANGANQLQTGSAIFYRNATNSTWIELPMTFYSLSGNNKYFSGTIPANTFQAGDVVQYYLRIPYSDRLPTFLYTSGGSSQESEVESVAQANPFSYTVLPPPPPGLPSPDDWRNLNIYQIFMDRFNDGDPSNNTADPEDFYSPGSSLGIHGGDLKGVEKKLDYIKALGANAIWISPLPLTAGTNVAYHGYVARNFYQLAPHWGTVADLTNMVAQAHARGIYVVLDVVVNHQSTIIDSGDAGFPAYSGAGYNMRWTVATNQYPAPFNSLSYFHNHGNIANYDDATQVQIGDLRGLDDLLTETEYVRTNLVKIYKYWMDLADFDGFRLDASKHAEIGFWQHWNPEIRAYAAAKGKTNFFTYGENISGDAANGAYTGTKSGAAFANDSALDYPLYNSIGPVFGAASGNTKQIEDHYNAIPTYYDPYSQDRLVTFLDNHDKVRFMSSGVANNNMGRLANALSFLYSSRGIPCVYQGTEQAFNGGTSPNNREDVFDGQFEQGPSLGDNFDMTHPAFLHIAQLNNLRRLYPALRTGTHINRWNNPSGPGLFAYARRLDTQEVLVVLNTAGSSQTLPERSSLYAPGTVMVNLFNTNETITVTGSSTTPSINVPATSYKMFIAQSQWQPLDPVVTNQSPAHAVGSVNVQSPLVFRFSKPMNTNSVQSALSIAPSVSGSFAWNTARTEMTFSPSGIGFAALTTIVVRVETGAVDSVDGKAFFSPFETFFVTAASTNTDVTVPTLVLEQPLSGSTLGGSLLVSGTATDDVSVLQVEVRLDGGDWLSAAGTTAWSYFINTSNALNGSHAIAARARDTSGNLSTSAEVVVRFVNEPGAYDLRIGSGNATATTNCDASVWLPDQPYTFGGFGYVGGITGLTGNAISGVCAEAQSLYQYERYAPAGFDYVADCPAGIYEITVLEVETFWNAANKRVFDLYIEGQQVLTNYDIFVAAGGQNIPLSLVFTAAVADARAEIHFVPQIDATRVTGVRVHKIGDVDTDGDGTPDWWMLAHFDHATGQDGDESQALDDPDDDGFSNWSEYIAGTDPMDPQSLLRVEFSGSGAISFWSASGRTYDVEANNVTDETWFAIATNQLGTGNSLLLPITNGPPTRWYRARVRLVE